MKRNVGTNHRGPAIINAGSDRLLCITIVLFLTICHATEKSSGSNDESSGGRNDGSSQVSSDNQSHDAQDEWYADDPYMKMIDDYVRQEMNTELEEEEEDLGEIAETVKHTFFVNLFVAGSISIIGLASVIYCTAIFLYFSRVDILMRRYSHKGVIVDGRILASLPDIHEEMKKCTVVEKMQSHDSYSVLTDDESSRSEYSGSDGSKANDNEERKKRGTTEDQGQHQHHTVINGAHSSVAASRQQIMEVNSSNKRKFHSKSFRVIVEYDDITYHDEIEQMPSQIISKRMLLMGEDIFKLSENSSNVLVKLYVIENQPLSGYPCGEVRRSLRWQKRLSFNVYVMFTIALIIGGVFATKHLLSPELFAAYIGIMLFQVPLLNYVLDGSFSKIILDRYLENGLNRPLSNSNKQLDDKEKMIAALKHGTSFGFE